MLVLVARLWRCLVLLLLLLVHCPDCCRRWRRCGCWPDSAAPLRPAAADLHAMPRPAPLAGHVRECGHPNGDSHDEGPRRCGAPRRRHRHRPSGCCLQGRRVGGGGGWGWVGRSVLAMRPCTGCWSGSAKRGCLGEEGHPIPSVPGWSRLWLASASTALACPQLHAPRVHMGPRLAAKHAAQPSRLGPCRSAARDAALPGSLPLPCAGHRFAVAGAVPPAGIQGVVHHRGGRWPAHVLCGLTTSSPGASPQWHTRRPLLRHCNQPSRTPRSLGCLFAGHRCAGVHPRGHQGRRLRADRGLRAAAGACRHRALPHASCCGSGLHWLGAAGRCCGAAAPLSACASS